MPAIATFALGCFWSPDDYFSRLPGVLQTTVGYTGGTKVHPTYESLGDHTEALQVEYDSSAISYKELLRHFWEQHDPSILHKTQYKSAIFYHNEEERREAEESKAALEKARGRTPLTEILPVTAFYRAEEYHQKYLRKSGGEA